eukprot:gene27089-32730_t
MSFGLSLVALSMSVMSQGVTPDAAAESSGTAAIQASSVPSSPTRAHVVEMAVKAPSSPLVKVVNTGERYVSVGNRGHILVSTDAKNWQQVKTPVDSLLTSVTFTDTRNGWAVGHDSVILHTSDGGATWMLQNFQPDLNKPLFDVLFIDANRGYAVGAYGLFLSTTDGGVTWSQIEVNPVTEDERHLNALTKLGDGSLMVIGEAGLVGLSNDAGDTWIRLKSPYESSLFCVIPAGDKGALIGGLRGNLFYSDDVQTGDWSKIETKTDQSLFGMAALPRGEVAMVGLNATLILLGKNRVVRQIPINDPRGNRQTETLSWVLPADDGAVLVVGDSGVQRLDASEF